MKLNKYTYIITITLLLFATSINARNDNIPHICNNVEFLACMGINKNKCKSADKKTKTTCSKKHPISPDAEREEKFSAARNYGQCAFSNMASNLDANMEKFGKCLTSSKHIKQLEKIVRESK